MHSTITVRRDATGFTAYRPEDESGRAAFGRTEAAAVAALLTAEAGNDVPSPTAAPDWRPWLALAGLGLLWAALTAAWLWWYLG